MALTNNEKQIRRKQLEALKKYGNDVLLYLILSNSHIRGEYNKSNEELKAEIDDIVNLPNGWTNEDYKTAEKKNRASITCGIRKSSPFTQRY